MNDSFLNDWDGVGIQVVCDWSHSVSYWYPCLTPITMEEETTSLVLPAFSSLLSASSPPIWGILECHQTSGSGRPSGPRGTWRTVRVVTVFTILVTWGGKRETAVRYSPGGQQGRVLAEGWVLGKPRDMALPWCLRGSELIKTEEETLAKRRTGN